MADIVRLNDRRRARGGPRRGGPGRLAEILLFTGVRYHSVGDNDDAEPQLAPECHDGAAGERDGIEPRP